MAMTAPVQTYAVQPAKRCNARSSAGRVLGHVSAKLNPDFIVVAPDNLARVARVPVARQPKAEYVGYVVNLFFERQFRATVGHVD